MVEVREEDFAAQSMAQVLQIARRRIGSAIKISVDVGGDAIGA
jgi:hypothetical protein